MKIQVNAFFKLLIFTLLITTSASAEGITITPGDGETVVTGKIITSDGKPAEYIQVFLLNSRFGTLSDRNGNFTFTAPSGSHTLVVQSITCHRITMEIYIPHSGTFLIEPITIVENSRQIGEVVVTGQFSPRSMQNSVYRVRSISNERIRQSGATQLKGLLETELGIQFRNDLATGESDIQLMGMSGQNVKILLDGIPVIDRGSNRQSLSHLDLNTIRRVEIVEGPMSVQYGTDALAGVINLISVTGDENEQPLRITARVMEESAGSEYSFGDGKGTHMQHVGLVYNHASGWFAEANATRNNFGGYQGINTGRAKEWRAREQLMGQAGTGFRGEDAEMWYRLNLLDEVIIGEGDINPGGMATDKDFVTTRMTHQLQGSWRPNYSLSLNAMGSFQQLDRQTRTTTLNTLTGDRRLSLAQGDQDLSELSHLFGRVTATNRFTDKISVQAGVEYRWDTSSGERVQGNPSITDYSLFVSAEWQPVQRVEVRPGLRFSENSVYEAPPVIPSINTRITLGQRADFRASYGKGFRAPALRELYFWFFNANHSIRGNTNLRAEHSDSFSGSLTFRPLHDANTRLNLTLSGFYNHFNDLITIARDADEPEINTFINIATHKTTGGTFEASLTRGHLQAGAGFSHVGRYNRHAGIANSPSFDWSPEINANARYRFEVINTTLSMVYKYTGRRPFHEIVNVGGQNTLNKAYIDAFHHADLTATKSINNHLDLQIGVKNLFDVTSVRNSSLVSGGHNTTGPMPLGFGRSWFAGLSFTL